MNKIIEQLESERIDPKVPDFSPGDTVLVQVKVKEGDRERVQAYEGIVIAKRNRGFNSSFTVRKMSHGEGVERVFQTYSPVDRRRSRSSVAATCAAPSSTTCAISPARPRASKKRSDATALSQARVHSPESPRAPISPCLLAVCTRAGCWPRPPAASTATGKLLETR